MTSTTTTIKAVSDGTDTKPAKPEHGLAVLREKEVKALISMACDALSETHTTIYDIHDLIYQQNKGADIADDQIQQNLEEALTCWQTTDHYLRMLSSVLDERRTGESPVPF